MSKIWGCILCLAPGAALACWPTQDKPRAIENTEISGIITYQQKPIRGAMLRLEDASGHLVAKSQTDVSGAFMFHKMNPGKYRLRMLKPSYESVEVNLLMPQPSRERTSLRINFYADFCQTVKVVPTQ
jgi:hypothetical protein